MTLVDETNLLDHLFAFLHLSASPATIDLEESVLLAVDTLSCILHASLFNERFWTAFSSREDVSDRIRQLILTDPRVGLRQMIGMVIANFVHLTIRYGSIITSHLPVIANYGSSFPLERVREMVLLLWRVLSSTLSTITGDLVPHCAQLFETTLVVLRVVGNSSSDALKLEESIRHWIDLLTDHHHSEVSRGRIDRGTLTLTRLGGWTRYN